MFVLVFDQAGPLSSLHGSSSIATVLWSLDETRFARALCFVVSPKFSEHYFPHKGFLPGG